MFVDRRKAPGRERPEDGAAGERSVRSPGQAGTSACRATRLDVMRVLAAKAVTRIEKARGAERAGYLIQLRAVQDEIAHLKHRHPILGGAPCDLAWVDGWSPPR